MRHRTVLVVTLCALVLLSGTSVSAQDDFQVINVNYIELQVIPEEISTLRNQNPIFTSELSLNELLMNNETYFWEHLGQYDSTLSENESVSSFAVVQINQTGFHQTIVGLSPDNQSLQWIDELGSVYTSNFSIILDTATSFFADDGHYWGRCEEIMILPGSLVSLEDDVVWRLQFHLVAESEGWVLILNSLGSIISTQSWQIPCQTCDPLPMIIGTSAVIAIAIVILFVVFKKKSG